ncbi:helix-turn-helix domain-containing protein [Schinkia azotoformans]|uniref:helix-turn-helix domain-containing protein n=1 Tax=Schinkia azotoformans TaxID=1454 RepID=UPI002DBF73FB|nr:helix-turn-helix transcriptional regulator [Schinkia azotoformans]MEC1720932.1 helix-turn-helix transcriptional regulator [Schinkia azotoformans]MED4412183.1 helix-turn-helix transcriptional regulator [Schinkia azotoformans]
MTSKTKIESNHDYINRYSKIANMIEARRKELNLSLKDIEEMTGLCSPAISRLTSVSNRPRLDTLYKVLDALDLDIKIERKEKEANLQNLQVSTSKNSNQYNVWVKKGATIDLLKVKAKTKYEVRQILSETNPEWEICTIELYRKGN